MTEIKLRLSLNVPGAQLLSEQECSKNPKDNYTVENITAVYPQKKGKPKIVSIPIKIRKNRLVKQSLNISKEAYDYMIDPNSAPTDKLNKKVYIKKVVGKKPDGSSIKKTIESTAWAQYQKRQRLEWYLKSIAESLGAVSYTYEIFED